MARPMSPCGTYAAYRRHLKRGEVVDPACRRAQRERDGSRSAEHRRRDVERPQVAPAHVTLPVPVVDLLRADSEEQREMFEKCAADLVEFARNGDLYSVEHLMAEMNDVLVEWCFHEAAILDERGEEAPDWLARVVDEARSDRSGAERRAPGVSRAVVSVRAGHDPDSMTACRRRSRSG